MSLELLQEKLKWRNIGGYAVAESRELGIAPYFLNTIGYRINRRMATNVVITGEPGIGKSYLATDIPRILHKDFSVEQVVYTHHQYMDLITGHTLVGDPPHSLKMGEPIVFDEPSYAIGHREWAQQLNKVIVKTIESQRFLVHPLFIPVVNKSLLDVVVRSYLLQYQVIMKDKSYGTVYRISPSQFTGKIYNRKMCDLYYNLLDIDQCDRESCLGCRRLQTCMIFRAQYERRKQAISGERYEKGREVTEAKVQAAKVSEEELEEKLYSLRDRFVYTTHGFPDTVICELLLQEEYNLKIPRGDVERLKRRMILHHPELFRGRRKSQE